jgi:hypothetical protein
VTFPLSSLTPYVTPAVLTQAPTGISWSTIPPGRDTTYEMRLAEQQNICDRATAQVDEYCNQLLRASIDNEQYSGPDYRMTIQQHTGNCRMILQSWPVTSILSIEVSPNTFPRRYYSLTEDYWDIEWPPLGIYGTSAPGASANGGQSIIFAPSVSWCLGRNGFQVRVGYINGWPHTGLTTAAVPGDEEIQVNDCTGWSITSEATGVTGATGKVYDSGSTEVVQVTEASATSGPGTLSLATAIQFSHDVGTMISTLPASVIWATTLFATSIALTRGATATTIQTIPGGSGSTGGSKEPGDLAGEAELLLNPYRRVI